MSSKIQKELAFLLTGKDVSASRAMKGVSGSISALERHTGKAFRNVSSNLQHGLEAGALGAAGAIAYSVKKAADFEAGMNTINTVALATPAALGKAAAGLRSIFRETGQPIEDLQAAEYDLVSAGIKLQDSQAGLNASVKLGRGAYGTTAEAVDVLTTAVNSYNLKAADGTVKTATWTRISDELAQAVADGKVKLSEIAATYAQVAPLAAQAGISTTEVAASLGFLTAKGNTAGETLTQMSRAIIELQKPNAKLNALQNKTGINFAKLAKEKGLAFALQRVRTEATKAHVPLIKLFGRIEGYKYALQVTGSNAKGFAEELDRVTHSAGMTQKQFEERSQGLNYQMGILKANVDDAAITIGTALIPQLVDLAREGTGWIQAHQGDISKFATDLAAGLKDAVKWARSLDWDKITASLQAGAGFAKGLIDAFAHAPSWVQEFLIGGFVANKFTGGVLGDIGGDILGSIGKGLVLKSLGIRAGIVNVNGPVAGGGGIPGGGGGGAAGGAAGIAENVAPLGIAAFLGTAAVGGAIGIVAASVEKGITDALTGPIHDLTGLSTDRINAGADQSRSQAFGGIAALADLPGTVNKMSTAANQLGVFINSPHPDFLGDLGRLAMVDYHGPAGPAVGPVSNAPLGEHAAAEATVTAIDRMKTRLAVLLEQGRHAQDAGETGRANRLHAKIVDLKAQIRTSEQATARAVADTKRATDEAKAAQVAQIRLTGSTTATTVHGTTAAVVSAQSAIVAAINASKPVTNVEVRTYASAADVKTSAVARRSYGPLPSSHIDNNNGKGP